MSIKSCSNIDFNSKGGVQNSNETIDYSQSEEPTLNTEKEDTIKGHLSILAKAVNWIKTQFAKYLPLSGGTMSGDIDMGGKHVKNGMMPSFLQRQNLLTLYSNNLEKTMRYSYEIMLDELDNETFCDSFRFYDNNYLSLNKSYLQSNDYIYEFLDDSVDDWTAVNSSSKQSITLSRKYRYTAYKNWKENPKGLPNIIRFALKGIKIHMNSNVTDAKIRVTIEILKYSNLTGDSNQDNGENYQWYEIYKKDLNKLSSVYIYPGVINFTNNTVVAYQNIRVTVELTDAPNNSMSYKVNEIDVIMTNVKRIEDVPININYDSTINPTQTGTTYKSLTSILQYFAQGINWLRDNKLGVIDGKINLLNKPVTNATSLTLTSRGKSKYIGAPILLSSNYLVIKLCPIDLYGSIFIHMKGNHSGYNDTSNPVAPTDTILSFYNNNTHSRGFAYFHRGAPMGAATMFIKDDFLYVQVKGTQYAFGDIDIEIDSGNDIKEYLTYSISYKPIDESDENISIVKTSNGTNQYFNTFNFDANIEPTQTGEVQKTVNWILQYLTQGVNWLRDKISTLYTKPSTGIPATDLASDVQTSLNKADSALQGIDDGSITLEKLKVKSFKINGTEITLGDGLNNENNGNGVLLLGAVQDGLAFCAVRINGDVLKTIKPDGEVKSTLYFLSAPASAVATSGDYNDLSNKPNIQAPIGDLNTIRSNATNGNTAYGWGNHADAGYAIQTEVTEELNHVYETLLNKIPTELPPTNNSVTNTKIADGSISTSKIQDKAIIGSKIGEKEITTNHIANSAITNEKLANHSIMLNGTPIALGGIGQILGLVTANGSRCFLEIANNELILSKPTFAENGSIWNIEEIVRYPLLTELPTIPNPTANATEITDVNNWFDSNISNYIIPENLMYEFLSGKNSMSQMLLQLNNASCTLTSYNLDFKREGLDMNSLISDLTTNNGYEVYVENDIDSITTSGICTLKFKIDDHQVIIECYRKAV